jgi:hypothetical protein
MTEQVVTSSSAQESSAAAVTNARLADIWMANKIELKAVEELIP